MQRWEQFNQLFGKEDSLEKQAIGMLIVDLLHQIDWNHVRNLMSIHAGMLDEVVCDAISSSYQDEYPVDRQYAAYKAWLQQEVEDNAE